MTKRNQQHGQANGHSFADFCRVELGMDRRHAHYQIEGASVYENVNNCSQTYPILPSNEAQCRPLTRLKSPACRARPSQQNCPEIPSWEKSTLTLARTGTKWASLIVERKSKCREGTLIEPPKCCQLATNLPHLTSAPSFAGECMNGRKRGAAANRERTAGTALQVRKVSTCKRPPKRWPNSTMCHRLPSAGTRSGSRLSRSWNGQRRKRGQKQASDGGKLPHEKRDEAARTSAVAAQAAGMSRPTYEKAKCVIYYLGNNRPTFVSRYLKCHKMSLGTTRPTLEYLGTQRPTFARFIKCARLPRDTRGTFNLSPGVRGFY